jgi:hypothetical protein
MQNVSSAVAEQLESIRISDDGVAEMDWHRAVIFVPRDEVLRLELGYGSGAERPLVTLALAIVCAVLAVTLMTVFALAMIRGGVRVPLSLVTGFAFLIPAWWLLDFALRKRWFLTVHTRTGSRKLVFHTTCDQAKVEQFVVTAKARFGYS